MLYEVNANTESWMVAGRKRGHVSLSEKQGAVNYLLALICFGDAYLILPRRLSSGS